LLRQRFAIAAGVDLRLVKRIPMAAGLAGGSSDAAATLAGLNRLWSLGLDAPALGKLGAELGSDVSFFFFGPAAWCTGRGEIVEPLQPGRSLHLVLASPQRGLSTASVFKALRLPERPVDGAVIRRAFLMGDVNAVAQALFNRLEEPAEQLNPEVGRLRQLLAESEPAGVLMSGSGSSVFAIARDAADARRIARELTSVREDGGPAPRVYVVRSCAGAPSAILRN